MFDPAIWMIITADGIGSQAPDYGKSPAVSPDGPPSERSGPPAVPARGRASRASELGRWIRGICGPTFLPMSEPTGPLASWESRLMLRLARIGSTEQPLIWKTRATPSGRSISRLAPSTRRTAETEFYWCAVDDAYAEGRLQSQRRIGTFRGWRGDADARGAMEHAASHRRDERRTEHEFRSGRNSAAVANGVRSVAHADGGGR